MFSAMCVSSVGVMQRNERWSGCVESTPLGPKIILWTSDSRLRWRQWMGLEKAGGCDDNEGSRKWGIQGMDNTRKEVSDIFFSIFLMS